MKKNKIKSVSRSILGSVLLLFPISLSLSCSGNDKKIDVGATVWNSSDPFMGVVKQGFKKGAKISGQTFSWVDGEKDQAKMNDKITALINSGVKALAINLVNPSGAQVVVDKAKASKLPIILYNKEASLEAMSSYDKVWYVGTKSIESGEMQVEVIARAIKDGLVKDRNKDGKLEYFIINGESEHVDASKRTEAVRIHLPKELAKVEYQTDFSTLENDKYKWFDNSGPTGQTTAKWAVNKATSRLLIAKGATINDLDKIYKDNDYSDGDPKNKMYNTTDWGTTAGEEKAAPKIASMRNNLDFIAANNDGTALGAVNAIKKKSFIKLDSKEKANNYANGNAINYMPIFGIDATNVAKSSIKEGWLTGTVLNDGINQGTIAMLMAVNSYKKGTKNTDLMTGIDPKTYKFINELDKPSKAIRVKYKAIYRDFFDKFK